tara:strand:- start:2702 stop:3928 length:1227 start_codon:yes stop_codon:yes gene_type:complete
MKIANNNKILYLLLSLSLIIGLFYGEDSSGSGGSIADFRSTWPLVENPLNFDCGCEMKFPLHYYIASLIFKIGQSEFFLKFTYCLAALTVPILLYKCLNIKYPKLNKDNLFLFSLLILLLPTLRSAAIWPNTHLTAIIFFLISIYFFLKWEIKKNFKKINKELMLTIFFMSLTVYTRQMYAMIFLYFVFIFFQNLQFKIFIKTCLIIFSFSIPGIIFVYFYPIILTGTFNSSLYNSLLVNSSIISFYLIPFYFLIFTYHREKLDLINLKNITVLFFIILIVWVMSQSFDYNFKMGGGYFLKLSLILFGDFNFFYLTSIIGFFLLYLLGKNKPNNIILILLILFGFSARILFPKYFEPMLIILLFFVFSTKLPQVFLKEKRNIYLYGVYMLIYLITGIVNQAFQITKTL